MRIASAYKSELQLQLNMMLQAILMSHMHWSPYFKATMNCFLTLLPLNPIRDSRITSIYSSVFHLVLLPPSQDSNRIHLWRLQA